MGIIHSQGRDRKEEIARSLRMVNHKGFAHTKHAHAHVWRTRLTNLTIQVHIRTNVHYSCVNVWRND